MKAAVFVVLAWSVAAGVAVAQESHVQLNVGGGFAATAGPVEDRFGSGGQLEAGVTFLPRSVVGFRIDYGYTTLGGREIEIPIASTREADAIATAILSSHMRMHSVSFNVTVGTPESARARAYFIGGPGVYHRSADLRTSSIGFVTVCDPYWYVCFDDPVVVDDVIGERSSTDLGMNVGGGVSFRVAPRASVYVETRYVYVWGPRLPSIAPRIAGIDASTRANGQFLPVTVGVRW